MIAHHISKGETIGQSLKDRLDYGKNPEKTQGGKLISAYECDHQTADAEFLLSKAKYKAVTSREQKREADVLCYQIRQSFVSGEITPEEANRVGYETAMRWTKGRHAFFVATHMDKKHIHNHIYYNPISLDYSRKLRDFWRSAAALEKTAGLMAVTVEYARTQPVFDSYKAARYSKKYLAEHEAELSNYRATKAALNELLAGEKLPKMADMKKARQELAGKKKALYAEYHKARWICGRP